MEVGFEEVLGQRCLTKIHKLQKKRELVANGSCLRVVNTITYKYPCIGFLFLITYKIGFLG